MLTPITLDISIRTDFNRAVYNSQSTQQEDATNREPVQITPGKVPADLHRQCENGDICDDIW